MKKLLFALAIAVGIFVDAQLSDSADQKQLYVKANALFVPIGVLNAGLEYQINNKVTVQAEVFISPWKSFMDKYSQIYMIGLDTRYYFNKAFKHWYVGANISAARFKMQKWNYWGDDYYQSGFGLIAGAVAGYQWQLNENWNLDLFVGAGTIQSFYRGYQKTLGVRYDIDPTRDYNRSGEWLPYRGGLMLSYKLK